MAASTLPDARHTVNWPRMRPRFTLELVCSADHLMDALRADEVRDAPGTQVEGTFSERHGVLTVPEKDRQFWSTHLSLTIEEADTSSDGTSRPARVLGVFSPQPEIWTAYVFAIGILTVIGVFSMMYAVVQITLGHWPWALACTLIVTLLSALLYTSTLVGQGLAAGEMYELRSHLDDRLDQARRRTAREPATARDSSQL
jgi:hypothetical protein